MERCVVSGEQIISSPDWVFHNPAKQYSTRIKRIGKNILFAWVDSDKPVALEQFEMDLVLKVLEDSSLEDKPFHVIWNLEHVKKITYSYKRGIVNFLYNAQPPLRSVVFYNIMPGFLNTVESIQAILPSFMKLHLTRDYNSALRITLDYISEEKTTVNDDENHEYEKLKKNFLRAAAMIGWVNMFDQNIHLPPEGHELYPFFSALSFMQEDFASLDTLHTKKKQNLQKTYTEKIKSLDAEISSIENEKQKLLELFEKEKFELKQKLSFRRNEFRQIGMVSRNRNLSLHRLSVDINALAPEQKKQMSEICDSLLETEQNEKKIDLPLTSTDSAFLSLLQQRHSNLKKREIKICLLIKLNYDNTDIADFYGISKRGMESLRYRMHKKIGLKKNQSLKKHLTALAAVNRKSV